MKKISLLFLFIHSLIFSFSQRLSIGIGLQQEADFGVNSPFYQVNDSILILVEDTKNLKTNNSDLRFFLVLDYALVQWDRTYYSIGLVVNTRYVDTDLLEYEEINNQRILVNRGIIPNRNFASILYNSFGLKRKRINLDGGLGIGFHIRDISKNIDDRESYDRIYQALQQVHKSLTVNYRIRFSYAFAKNFSFFGQYQESIGQVSREINLFDNTEKIALRWRSLGVGFSYNFDPLRN
ncbi:MAG: hypothetical protein AAF616_10825 [Bacteroidota bacterium]